MTTISAHTYDALREKFDELCAENARLRAELDVVRSTLNASDAVLSENLREKTRLRAALAAAPRWVPVAERLPEPGEDYTVVVQTHRDRLFAWVSRGGGWRRYDDSIGMTVDVFGVTHWLELPPAPEVTAL